LSAKIFKYDKVKFTYPPFSLIRCIFPLLRLHLLSQTLEFEHHIFHCWRDFVGHFGNTAIIPLSSFSCRISSKKAWCNGLGFFPPVVLLFTAGSATLFALPLAAMVHDGAQDSCLFFFGVEPRKSPIKKNWAIKKKWRAARMHAPTGLYRYLQALVSGKKKYYAAPRPGYESSFFGVALSKL